jgi:hypothetical protein
MALHGAWLQIRVQLCTGRMGRALSCPPLPCCCQVLHHVEKSILDPRALTNQAGMQCVAIAPRMTYRYRQYNTGNII